MAETNSQHRQPQYAALHAAPDKDAAKVPGDAPAQSASVESNYLAIEADRLENLKLALYAAFVDAPKTGIPTALVDLAATYTSALRLQMSLRGYSAMPTRSVKAPMFSASRAK